MHCATGHSTRCVADLRFAMDTCLPRTDKLSCGANGPARAAIRGGSTLMKWKLGRPAVRAAMVDWMIADSVVLANGQAHAAEGQWTLSTSHCSAVVKIELHSYPVTGQGAEDATESVPHLRCGEPGVRWPQLLERGPGRTPPVQRPHVPEIRAAGPGTGYRPARPERPGRRRTGSRR